MNVEQTVVPFIGHNSTTPFELEGSVVDIPVMEKPLPLFPDKKGIYKTVDGEPVVGLGIVGKDYPLTTHVDFFKQQHDMLQRKLPTGHLDRLQIKYKVAKKGAFALQDIIFPSIAIPIETNKHRTTISLRYVSWHGVDGQTSNNGVFGAIDFFCENGSISGEFDTVRRKNTKNFELSAFIDEVEQSVDVFYERAKLYQAWAAKSIHMHQALACIEKLPGITKAKATKLYDLYINETLVRGHNVWTLYSAMTNYSSHVDNGFALRRTRSDHAARSMLSREFEVVKWISSPSFEKLAA